MVQRKDGGFGIAQRTGHVEYSDQREIIQGENEHVQDVQDVQRKEDGLEKAPKAGHKDDNDQQGHFETGWTV